VGRALDEAVRVPKEAARWAVDAPGSKRGGRHQWCGEQGTVAKVLGGEDGAGKHGRARGMEIWTRVSVGKIGV
jgi:hypothetical protein